MSLETVTEREPGTVLVTEAGFRPGSSAEAFVPADGIAEGTGPLRIELAADGDPAALARHFGRALVIRIPFRSFSDGRGFTLARELRRLGYRGRIRASGHLISDQWPLARACGIDEVEIGAAQALRQPEESWRLRRRGPGYLDVLR
jgi:uncharacterized protein (DUF934 family)